MKHVRLFALGLIVALSVVASAQDAPTLTLPEAPKSADGWGALPYYSFTEKKPSVVAAHKIDLPKFLSFAQPFFDRYRLELDGFAGISTDTTTKNPLKVGFDVGRSFTIPKTSYQCFAALAVEVSANKPVGGGLILGFKF